MSYKQSVQKILRDVDAKLREPGLLNDALSKLEQKTKMQRLPVITGESIGYGH